MKKAYLVGHGNLHLQSFIELLQGNEIGIVVDVRSVPYSKFASQFNRESLRQALNSESIEYIYMGDCLGGRQGLDVSSPEFREAISRLVDSIQSGNTAIMCSEIDYSKCHRRHIGARLRDMGIAVEALSTVGLEAVSQKTLAGFT